MTMVDVRGVPDNVVVNAFGPLVLRVDPASDRGADDLLRDPPQLFVRWFNEETDLFVEERISFGAALAIAPGLYLHMATALGRLRSEAREAAAEQSRADAARFVQLNDDVPAARCPGCGAAAEPL